MQRLVKQKQTRDFLIRNIPSKVYTSLEKLAKAHHRSKTKEALIALMRGLSLSDHHIKQPEPFDWNTKISTQLIVDAINEGQS